VRRLNLTERRDDVKKKKEERSMNPHASRTQIKSRGWLWKIPLGLLILLLIVLAVAVLSINTIANNQINRAMKDMLTEGGSWRQSTSACWRVVSN
jgi:hypothetical protein